MATGAAGVLQSRLPDPRGITTHFYPAICFPHLPSATAIRRKLSGEAYPTPRLVKSHIFNNISNIRNHGFSFVQWFDDFCENIFVTLEYVSIVIKSPPIRVLKSTVVRDTKTTTLSCGSLDDSCTGRKYRRETNANGCFSARC